MRITKCINIPTYMLAMVIYNKGKKTTTDVQRTLNMTYSSIFDINKSLIELKWATTEPMDGKSIAIVLTEKGKGIVEAIIIMLEKIGIVLNNEEEKENVSNRSESQI